MKKNYCTSICSTYPIEFTYLIVLLLGLAGCSDDESPNPMIIDPQVQGLVDLFIQEAEARKVELDIRGLTIEFLDELTFDNAEGVCGIAISLSPNAKVQISQSCWDGLSDNQKEILIFHELGHALLHRLHDEREFENGSDVSIMKSRSLSAYRQWTIDRRDYYLDELFATHDGAIPEWAMIKENARIVYEDNFDSLGIWQLVTNRGETPEAYIMGGLDSGSYDSAPYSLAITSNEQVESDVFHYWRIRLDNLEIAPDSQLKLVARIRGENIDGRGLTLSMRGDEIDGSTAITYDAQTFDDQGTFGFRYVNLYIDTYTPVVDRLSIFFEMSSSTSGTAYLDDLRLIEKF